MVSLLLTHAASRCLLLQVVFFFFSLVLLDSKDYLNAKRVFYIYLKKTMYTNPLGFSSVYGSSAGLFSCTYIPIDLRKQITTPCKF